jgi:hypothetical protein
MFAAGYGWIPVGPAHARSLPATGQTAFLCDGILQKKLTGFIRFRWWRAAGRACRRPILMS